MKNNIKYQRLFLFGIGALIALAIMGTYVAYLAFFPRETATITQPIVVSNNPVVAGSVVDYTINIERKTAGAATVKRTLQKLSAVPEELPIPLGDSFSELPVGQSEVKKQAFIPFGIPTDEYYIEFYICYQTSILQKQCGNIYSEPFVVIAPEDKDKSEVKKRAQEQADKIEAQRESAPSQPLPITEGKRPTPSDPSQTQQQEVTGKPNGDSVTGENTQARPTLLDTVDKTVDDTTDSVDDIIKSIGGN